MPPNNWCLSEGFHHANSGSASSLVPCSRRRPIAHPHDSALSGFEHLACCEVQVTNPDKNIPDHIITVFQCFCLGLLPLRDKRSANLRGCSARSKSAGFSVERLRVTSSPHLWRWAAERSACACRSGMLQAFSWSHSPNSMEQPSLKAGRATYRRRYRTEKQARTNWTNTTSSHCTLHILTPKGF